MKTDTVNNLSLKSRFRSAINRLKILDRFWMAQGLRRIASLKHTTAGQRERSVLTNSIDEAFGGLDRDSLVDRLNVGQDLYPNCDTSIWLRSCTHEIPNPVQGAVQGNIDDITTSYIYITYYILWLP